MKIPTLLSTSALALLVSMNISYGSDAVEADAPAEVTAPSMPAPVEEDGFAEAVNAAINQGSEKSEFGDVNGDGKRDFSDLLAIAKIVATKIFDFNNNKELDIEDLTIGITKLFNAASHIFAGATGKEEFGETLVANHTALDTNVGTSDRILSLGSVIVDSSYFAGIPENLKGPLTALLGSTGQAATETKGGKNIGGTYTASIKAALDGINKNIKHLTEGGMSAEETTQSRKDIFAYLEMVKGWYSTGDNAELVSKIEKKLNKIKA